MDVTPIMRARILKTSLSLGAVGLPGAFAAHWDMVAIVPAWSTLLYKLAKDAGKQLDKATITKIAGAVAVGVGSALAGVKLANSYFAYSGVGTIPAIGLNMAANGSVTYLMGMSAAKLFLAEDLDESVERIAKAILRGMGGAFG